MAVLPAENGERSRCQIRHFNSSYVLVIN